MSADTRSVPVTVPRAPGLQQGSGRSAYSLNIWAARAAKSGATVSLPVSIVR